MNKWGQDHGGNIQRDRWPKLAGVQGLLTNSDTEGDQTRPSSYGQQFCSLVSDCGTPAVGPGFILGAWAPSFHMMDILFRLDEEGLVLPQGNMRVFGLCWPPWVPFWEADVGGLVQGRIRYVGGSEKRREEELWLVYKMNKKYKKWVFNLKKDTVKK